MNNFLSVIIFVFPGLITFYWIQLFGFTPVTKFQGTEILAISFLLWIPINFFIVLIYDILSLIFRMSMYPFFINVKHNQIPVDIPPIIKIGDMISLANNFVFILFYVTLSLLISYKLAKQVNGDSYRKILSKINAIRIKNNKAPFSMNSTVWEEVFAGNNEQIIGILKIGSPEDEAIGVIKNVSRPLEPEHDIVLQNTFFWESVMNSYNVSVNQKFVDTKAGTVIKIYDLQQANEASQRYLIMHNQE